ncbi:MAG: class I SAM-dependent methyltransferase [Anaerolineae bacterium]|nr:methyltransferase domain-containing protein [Thermoflexales bacterium]MDW8407258.1 class I SAM-dependent methyltransferase [Anaerolineae bacterium]
MRTQSAQIDQHNQQQRRYFEQTWKRTMQPAGTPYLRRQTDEMVRATGITAGQRVLEVGCGMGRYTFLLAERGIRIEGLDLSPVLLDRLREYDGGQYNIPLYCTDISRPPSELEERFDSVIGFFTLHHLHDLELCFRGITRLVRPGGVVAFLEPNPYNPLYYLQILFTPGMTWEGDGGLIHMRRSVLFNAMRRAGLENLELTRFGFFPPFLTNRTWGARLESILERIPLWKFALPFQIIKGRKRWGADGNQTEKF